MVRNRVQERLDKFMERETFALTVKGALGHNLTYLSKVSEDRKGKFRESLRRYLNSQLEEYRAGRIDDDRHVANIEALSSGLSECHQDILRGGTFRIGTAQKALNLYLKYGWARGIIPEPPHCPIDSIVLAKIKKCPASVRCQICPNSTWTKICTTKAYLHFIDKAREAARVQGQSLACWELEIWDAVQSHLSTDD